jgi:uncharacterized membrane protein YqjE
MFEYLEKPFWQFIINATIAMLAIIVAAVVALYVYRKQSRKKALTYQVLANVPFLNPEMKDSLVQQNLRLILFDRQVQNAHLLIIDFENTGTKEIKTDDFETDLKLKFNKQTEILLAETVESTPENLPVKIEYKENIVFIKPLLLNPKDKFTVTILVSSLNSDFETDVRIAGVNKLDKYDELSARKAYITKFMILLVFSALVSLVAGIVTGFVLTIRYGKDLNVLFILYIIGIPLACYTLIRLFFDIIEIKKKAG